MKKSDWGKRRRKKKGRKEEEKKKRERKTGRVKKEKKEDKKWKISLKKASESYSYIPLFISITFPRRQIVFIFQDIV